MFQVAFCGSLVKLGYPPTLLLPLIFPATVEFGLSLMQFLTVILRLFNQDSNHRAEMLQMTATLRWPLDFNMSFARVCLLKSE